MLLIIECDTHGTINLSLYNRNPYEEQLSKQLRKNLVPFTRYKCENHGACDLVNLWCHNNNISMNRFTFSTFTLSFYFQGKMLTVVRTKILAIMLRHVTKFNTLNSGYIFFLQNAISITENKHFNIQRKKHEKIKRVWFHNVHNSDLINIFSIVCEWTINLWYHNICLCPA